MLGAYQNIKNFDKNSPSLIGYILERIERKMHQNL